MTNGNSTCANERERLEQERAALQAERERLERERQEFETMRNELQSVPFEKFKADVVRECKSLRETIEKQNTEIEVLKYRNNEMSNQNNFNPNLFFENFCLMNLDVKLPKFSDIDSMNPLKFLNESSDYISLKKIPDQHKLTIVRSALENRARMWFESKIFANYNDFEKTFRDEFYSIPVQVEIKSKWAARKQIFSGLSLESYFLKQFSEAVHFIPKMEKYEINFKIIDQLPFDIQRALIGFDYHDENKILRSLSRMDSIAKQKEKIDRKSRNAIPPSNFSENKTINFKTNKIDNQKTIYPNQNRGFNQNKPIQSQKPNTFQSYNVNSMSTQHNRENFSNNCSPSTFNLSDSSPPQSTFSNDNETNAINLN